mmetsp:Transcript_12553/g.19027  ORF Transcript_12553/g.19027 Transcript_12553/m.19027 type:complete len:81 (-) Transcript_12553:198-440(-)
MTYMQQQLNRIGLSFASAAFPGTGACAPKALRLVVRLRVGVNTNKVEASEPRVGQARGGVRDRGGLGGAVGWLTRSEAES